MQCGLDGGAGVAKDRLDLAAQEDERNDRDERDENEDQGVLGEALTFFAAVKDGRDECAERKHTGQLASFPPAAPLERRDTAADRGAR